MKSINNLMAMDQYGQTYHDLGKFPRKELLGRLGYNYAEKMYVDTTKGITKHVGYIIGGLWLTLYKVEEFSLI